MPKVSIIMRSRNDAWIIDRTLKGLQKQTFSDWELIHIDSDSDDDTAAKVKPYAHIQEIIHPSTYIPGKVLNRGAQLARGTLLIYLNSDCVPLDAHWLENMIAGLEQAPVIYGRQVARTDAMMQVQRDYLLAFPPHPRETHQTSTRWWRRNPSFENMFSMACSGVRKDLWKAYPFHPTLRYSEDIEWALRIRRAGHQVLYVHNAVVEHSHNYDASSCYKRFFGEGTAEAATFSQSPWERSFLRRAVIPYFSALAHDLRYSLQHGNTDEWRQSVWFRWSMHYGRYKGIQAQLHNNRTAFGAQNPNARKKPRPE
ncbi:MAG: glycosyltransferase [Myxococcota bacterium]